MDYPYKLLHDKVAEELQEKKASPVCVYCGSNNWAILHEAALVTQWSNQLPAPGIPVAVMICNNCGNIRMHALGALNMLPQEVKMEQNG
jgi:hypothetical protein